MDLRSIARALGGEVVGLNQVLAPGPGHSPRDRSLSFRIDPRAPDGFLVHSFAGDDPLVCKHHARELLRIERWQPGRKEFVAAPRQIEPVSVASNTNGDDTNRRLALAIWLEARPPLGTLVEHYLFNHRYGLNLPEDVAGDVIRFHPACPFGQERAPAMVCAMRSITSTDDPDLDDELTFTGIHRRRLTAEGQKAPEPFDKPMILGRAGIIKIDPDHAVTIGLVVSEGVETALAARQLGFRPVWALGTSGAIERFPVLPGLDGITLLAERNKDGSPNAASVIAVQKCGARWAQAGRDVVVAEHPAGDMNDALKGAS